MCLKWNVEVSFLIKKKKKKTTSCNTMFGIGTSYWLREDIFKDLKRHATNNRCTICVRFIWRVVLAKICFLWQKTIQRTKNFWPFPVKLCSKKVFSLMNMNMSFILFVKYLVGVFFIWNVVFFFFICVICQIFRHFL